ncbi:MAG TPA: hypothetical protein VEX68_15490 [Bryobacteraceae bacterium]|nr:hypothetical protein [Bryobacteraceae bacterium]
MKRLPVIMMALAVTTAPVWGSLTPKVTHYGNIRLSIDGAGTNAFSRTIRVNKPSAGATVRAAYLLAASTGYTGATIANGQITFAGFSISFTDVVPSSIQSWNYWTDVTSIVRPTLNAAAPGITSFIISEQNTSNIDGEILAVVWDDPTAPPTTVALMFGAQNIAGDSFTVTLARPIDKTNPQTVLNMSLGISYGFQPAGQYSILELGVNGTRISSSAGGYDDGIPDNGALITVGGIDDTNANPANPFQTDSGGPRYDDELYNLLPFVANGATSFTVTSRNPSNDDNIFFAAIVLGENTAVVGEGIFATPANASANVGGTQTVSALVQTSNGIPVAGRSVTCRVVSGPNLGTTKVAVTNGSGLAVTSFTSSLAGTDTIQCSMVNSNSTTQYSNLVTRTWLGSSQQTYSFVLTPTGDMNPVGTNHTLSAKLWNGASAPISGVPVQFEVVSGPNPGPIGATVLTNVFGIASRTYTSGNTGTQVIRASAQIGVNNILSNQVTKAWVGGGTPLLILTPTSATNPVKGQHVITATAYDVGGNVVAGVPVTFNITSGPNTGSLGTVATSAPSGSANRTWTSNLAGTDTIQATATINSIPVTSNIASKTWAGLLCDADNNGQIDNRDTIAVFAARNTLVPLGDVRDADFDGVITALDVRKCTLVCTKPGCAQ